MKTNLLLLALSAVALMANPTITRAQSADADVAAIKAVVEKETASWYKMDPDGLIDCWANVPEAGQLVTSPKKGGVSLIRNTKMDMPSGVKTVMAGKGSSNTTFQNTDYLIRVKGDAAFAQFEQVVTSPKGQKEYAHETRYLEKIDGQWKIIHVGAAFYMP